MRAITIAFALAQQPGRGGHTWVALQWALGFKKLGWDVLLLDRLDVEMAVDEGGVPAPIEGSWNVRYALDVVRRFGLGGAYSLLCDGGARTIGLDRAHVLDRVRASAALFNVMGFLRDEEILAAAPRRVFLDIDPGFGQMWEALGLCQMFRGHDAFVTIGENIGKRDCPIPTCGLPLLTTRQPIVLDEWPSIGSSTSRNGGAITTVARWRGAYDPVEFGGTKYGLRAHEFRRFAALPRRVDSRFDIALDIHSADARDRELLAGHGWTLIDPATAAGDPWRYRDFIQRSAAEVMIAKGMYTQTRSGWFSDRSICYLASGKPVLAQDTGLAELLPTGEGLLTFTDLDEAADAARAIERDYARHARAARRLAEECFDSTRVLPALTSKLGLG